MKSPNPAAKLLTSAWLAAVIILISFASAAALGQPQDKTERERALAAYESQNFVAALPLLEKAAAAYPDDIMILSRLGFALFVTSSTEKDPAVRAKARARAREILLKSQRLGDEGNLTKMTLDGLSHDDPSDVPFSNKQEAESAIRKGEDAFVRGDMDQALAAYKRALELDPQLYEAALYAGDAEFKTGYAATDERVRKDHFEKAGVWFAKAIAIDANRETAYRYWGDALDRMGRIDEARDKFVEAIIAEPYTRSPYVGLTQWADQHHVPTGHPNIEIPTNVQAKKPGEINITVDELALKGSDNDGSAAWLMYGIIRSGWMDRKNGGRSVKFAKAFPNETAYRHSLAEEIEALRGVVESAQVQMREKPAIKLTPSLASLVKLTDAGLLEAYVLFVMPDEGIALDYRAYRKSNRDQLRQYWLKIVIAGK